MTQLINVTNDATGGFVLSTSDQWLMQDVAESVVQTITAKDLESLRSALAGFNKEDVESTFALDDARYEIAKGQQLKDRIILARLVTHEIVDLIAQLQRALAAVSVAL